MTICEQEDKFAFKGVEGNPFQAEQDIWEEIYKLNCCVKAQSTELNESLKAFYLQQVAQVETQAEIVRQNGHSGLMKSRQYLFEYANDAGFSPANIHNHANFKQLAGSAEFSGALNGYYFRSRHNDYELQKNVENGDFLDTESISTIPVPPDVTGTVQQQTNVVKNYFKVLNGELPSSRVQSFGSAFRWVLSYIECWWEYLDGDGFKDPFFSPRHQINADTIRELVARDQYLSYGGHKHRFENQPHLPIAIKDVDDKGNPIICIFKYRCVCKEIGSLLDYPISDTVQPVYDYLTLKRFGQNHTSQTRRDRFEVIRPGYNNRQPGLLDEIMGKIYGLDGENSYLEEIYYNEPLLEYKKNTPLNSAKYNRYYSMRRNDAAGRREARRGFSDPFLFVAKTTRPEVFTRNYDDQSYAFSYAIPFEMHIQTFLDEWNPYDVPYVERSDFDGTDGSQNKPYPGFNDRLYYYHTPASLFSDVVDPDPADTSATTKYVICGDNVARPHAASGVWDILPNIPGVSDKVRTRYPVYPVYWEGNETHEQWRAK